MCTTLLLPFYFKECVGLDVLVVTIFFFYYIIVSLVKNYIIVIIHLFHDFSFYFYLII